MRIVQTFLKKMKNIVEGIELYKLRTTIGKPKSLTVWIIINCGKFIKRWEHQTT